MKYLCCIYNTILAGVLVSAFLAMWIYGSSVEAEVYNKVTGNNITTWDAMWSTYVITYGENCG